MGEPNGESLGPEGGAADGAANGAGNGAANGAASSAGTGAEGVPGASNGTVAEGPQPVARDRSALIEAGATRLAGWSARVLLIALGAVLLGLLIGQLWSIVLPTLLGVIIATVLRPPVRLLIGHRFPPALAAAAVLLAAVVLIGGIIALFAPQVAGQSDEIVSGVSSGIVQIQRWLEGPPFNLGDGQLGALLDQVVAQLQSSATTIAGGVLTGVGAFASGLINVVLAIILAFFFVKDGPRFLPWLSRVAGPKAGGHLSAVLERAWRTLGSFIRTQALVALIDGVFIGIGLAVLGVPLWFPLAVLTFFGGFVPIVGAFVAGALSVLIALVTQGLTTALIVLAIIVAVQQIEGNVLQPILQSRTMNLHAAVVLLAVTAGSTLFGIAGAFLSVPVAAVAAEVLRYLGEQLDKRTVPRAPDPEEPVDDPSPA
ncbi:AI-2E family transporter [Pseudonocardia pini]|uniref:AI-2E family transporter n=1 Tax=Pseudonocardia pini TaxID=2758030 RepID=UPI0028AA8586|nr:AI-2E family transporter [Pseudonocardia pini]